MRVLVVGAHGQIGSYIVKQLAHHDKHTVRAMVRKEEQAEDLKKQGIDTVIANLEGSKRTLVKASKGCDAVVFAAGSGGSTGPDKTLLVDLDGAVKMIEAAEEAGTYRFIMISALHANYRNSWADNFEHYFAAKHYADRMLEASNLNYTIIRPGGLLDEEGTGGVQLAEHLDSPGYISREDVARTVVASLDKAETNKRSFDVISGDIPVVDALNNL